MAKETIIALRTEKTIKGLTTAIDNHRVITEPTIMGMREIVPIITTVRIISHITTGHTIMIVPVTMVKTTTVPIDRQTVRHSGTILITGTDLIITGTTVHTITTETAIDHTTTDRSAEMIILNNVNGLFMKK